MKSTKRIVYMFIAIILILIGIIGLVLPVLNGVFFLLLGFILLSFESPYIEYHLQRLAKKNYNVDMRDNYFASGIRARH